MDQRYSQKFENLLILALNATSAELENSSQLNVGYNKELKTWDLIVKSSAPLDRLNSSVIKVTTLISGYSLVNIREDFLESFSKVDEVEYIEKPKALYFITH